MLLIIMKKFPEGIEYSLQYANIIGDDFSLALNLFLESNILPVGSLERLGKLHFYVIIIVIIC